MQRGAELQPSTWNAESRTIEVVWSTGAAVRRYDWWSEDYYDEVLSMDPAAVRLERLNNGASVLNSHGQWSLEDVIGTVVPGSARIVGDRAVATLRLSAREELSGIVADIAAGIIRNISVGYIIHKTQETRKDGQLMERLVTDWEPVEISFVPVPADAGAQARAMPQQRALYPCIIEARAAAPTQEETTMDETEDTSTGARAPATPTTPAPATPPAAQPAAERAVSIADIRARAQAAGLSADQTLDVIALHEQTPFTRGTLAEHLLDTMATRQSQPQNPRVSVSRDDGDTRRAALMAALYARANPGQVRPDQLNDVARGYRHFSLIRMAEEHLLITGRHERGLSPVEIASRALHHTSDFTNVLADAINKRLRAAYAENSPSYRRWSRRAPNAPDFKSISVTQLSALPDLLKVNESGEIKYGSISDGKTAYQVVTYGRMIGITRQALINDDLSAFDRIPLGFAGAASRLENRLVYAQLTSNPTMSDGTALFHSTHGNLAGSGAAISGTTLGAGRTAMRLQKGLQSEELNLSPAYLIVPATQEQLAYQYTSSQYVPAKPSDTNEFRAGGRTALEPIVEALLDGTSTTSWYLAADSAQVDTVEWCYLDGNEGVQLASNQTFGIDGVEFKAMLDFAASVIDYRGLYKNPGA